MKQLLESESRLLGLKEKFREIDQTVQNSKLDVIAERMADAILSSSIFEDLRRR
jgi:hypothetical protein